MKFNEQQLKAITARNRNVMVSASAGSGKTTLLVERLKRRILEDQLSIDQILAMTFTDKAAAEMKKKLATTLSDLYQQNPDNEFLRQQIELLPSAQISTIHSFCLSIIREFGYLISIDPEALSNIFDDKQIHQHQQTAKEKTNNLLFDLYKDNPDFINLLNFFSYRINNFDDLSEAYIDLYQKSQVQLDPQSYFDSILETYQKSSYPQQIKDLLLNIIKSLIEDYKLGLNDIEELFYESQDQQETFKNWLDLQHQILNSIDKSDNFNDIKQLSIKLLSVDKPKGKSSEYSKKRTEFIKGAPQKLAELITVPEDLTPLYPAIKILVEAAQAYGDFYAKSKHEGKGMDFNDIEHLAFLLLNHESQVPRKFYQQQFKEIMIDEFQDTNNYQNEIANMISNGNNIFRVGDVKQSIYGFRNARPQIMMDIIDHDEDPIYLSKNYRSSYNIVEFSNILFENLMNIEGSAMRYKGLDIVSIGLDKQKETTEPVEIHLIDPEQIILYQSPHASDYRPIKITNSLRVSYYIAQDILKKNKNGIPFKDMTVLIRTHGRKSDLKRAFDEIGVPYYIEDREAFYHSYSINDIANMIKFVFNPHDNIALFWILQSGFINLDENELAQLRLHSQRDSLYDKLKEVYPTLYDRLTNLVTISKDLSDLDKVLTLLNFNDYYQVHLNTQERTNVDLLISQLNDYLSKENHGLLGFIQDLEFSIDTKTSSAASISELDDVVKVHTVHQSKGLEYPITYFFGFKKDNKDQDIKKKYMSDDLGIAMKTPDYDKLTSISNLFREAIKVKKQYDTIHEEIRNLYVTLTRAKNQLIYVAINEEINENPLTLSDLLNGENYTKLIVRSLPRKDNDIYKLYFDTKVDPIKVIALEQTHSKKEDILISAIETHEVIDATEYSLTLNLQSTYALEYGTLLHNLIATNKNSDDEHIQEKLDEFRNHSFTLTLFDYPHSHEVPIAYKQDDQVMYGYIDLLVETDSEIIMVDYKSDHITDLSQLINRYNQQMNMYYQGLLRAYPNRPITQYLYSFALNQYIKVEN